jgi:hypothetical protein
MSTSFPEICPETQTDARPALARQIGRREASYLSAEFVSGAFSAPALRLP